MCTLAQVYVLLYRGRRSILLTPPRAPCPTVEELQVNRSTRGSTVMKRNETATISINLPWGTMKIVAYGWNETCSYRRAAVAKRSRPQQNLSDRELPGEYSCFPSCYGHTPCFATICYVLSRFVTLFPFYYDSISRSFPPWQIF